eukprot:9714274-Alexandrium_andersonii.AAC.1
MRIAFCQRTSCSISLTSCPSVSSRWTSGRIMTSLKVFLPQPPGYRMGLVVLVVPTSLVVHA